MFGMHADPATTHLRFVLGLLAMNADFGAVAVVAMLQQWMGMKLASGLSSGYLDHIQTGLTGQACNTQSPYMHILCQISLVSDIVSL